ncbi:hypothetical protein Tco_1027300 [Tanacetum coccineum]
MKALYATRYVIVQRSSRQKGFELSDDVVSFVYGYDANATKEKEQQVLMSLSTGTIATTVVMLGVFMLLFVIGYYSYDNTVSYLFNTTSVKAVSLLLLGFNELLPLIVSDIG